MRTLLVVAALLAAGAQTEWVQPASWTEPIEPFSIADDLHYVGTEGLAAFLLTGPEGHVLIDATLEENVPLLLANIREIGFEPADIRMLLSSHAHFDHTGGLAAMQEATGAEIVLSEQAARLAADGGRGDFFLGDSSPYRSASADRIAGHLETVRVGSRTLTAHLTPGHTRGCTSWSGTATIEGESRRFLLVCSLSVLEGYRLVGPEESYPGIAADFCGSVRHLRSQRAEIFLAPHGGFFELKSRLRALRAGDARAFVDVEALRRYVDGAEARIEETLTRQGRPEGCEVDVP